MQIIKWQYPCPVCGYAMDHAPRDFSICSSCGTEFGYQDAGTTFDELRKEWILSGAAWHSRVERKPKDWNPYLQMVNAGLLDIQIVSAPMSTNAYPVAPQREGIEINWQPSNGYMPTVEVCGNCA